MQRMTIHNALLEVGERVRLAGGGDDGGIAGRRFGLAATGKGEVPDAVVELGGKAAALAGQA
jgi:hypothetical protein